MSQNFIHDFIDEDLENGVYNKVQTRFPPEPNGYLHIGHAKAICINFATSKKYKGECNLRLDDTNPMKEDTEYIDAIKEDIEWLGFKWNNCLFASSYFDYIYECAVKLIEKGLDIPYFKTKFPELFDNPSFVYQNNLIVRTSHQDDPQELEHIVCKVVAQL